MTKSRRRRPLITARCVGRSDIRAQKGEETWRRTAAPANRPPRRRPKSCETAGQVKHRRQPPGRLFLSGHRSEAGDDASTEPSYANRASPSGSLSSNPTCSMTSVAETASSPRHHTSSAGFATLLMAQDHRPGPLLRQTRPRPVHDQRPPRCRAMEAVPPQHSRLTQRRHES